MRKSAGSEPVALAVAPISPPARTIGTDFNRWRRYWLLAFGLERIVEGWQFLGENLVELFCHFIQFPFKRVDVGDLVVGGFAFIAENRAVKLVGVSRNVPRL